MYLNKNVLSYLNKCEGWKTAAQELHWDSNSISQHELCDKISEAIAEQEDKIAEVEQSITGKLKRGTIKPEPYKVESLKKFVQDILDETNTFLKQIEKEGDAYIGMKSDCESFLSDMQRNLYLVNFTIKEDKTRKLTKQIVREAIEKFISEEERSTPYDLPPGDQDVHYPGDVNPDVLDSLQRGDFGDVENIMAFDVFTENLNLGNRREREQVLLSTLYDKNDNPIGRLNDFHFKYDPDANEFI